MCKTVSSAFVFSPIMQRGRGRAAGRPLKMQGMGSKLLVSLGTFKHGLEDSLILIALPVPMLRQVFDGKRWDSLSPRWTLHDEGWKPLLC